jgi:hypothetical protein
MHGAEMTLQEVHELVEKIGGREVARAIIDDQLETVRVKITELFTTVIIPAETKDCERKYSLTEPMMGDAVSFWTEEADLTDSSLTYYVDSNRGLVFIPTTKKVEDMTIAEALSFLASDYHKVRLTMRQILSLVEMQKKGEITLFSDKHKSTLYSYSGSGSTWYIDILWNDGDPKISCRSCTSPCSGPVAPSRWSIM